MYHTLFSGLNEGINYTHDFGYIQLSNHLELGVIEIGILC